MFCRKCPLKKVNALCLWIGFQIGYCHTVQYIHNEIVMYVQYIYTEWYIHNKPFIFANKKTTLNRHHAISKTYCIILTYHIALSPVSHLNMHVLLLSSLSTLVVGHISPWPQERDCIWMVVMRWTHAGILAFPLSYGPVVRHILKL